MDAKERSRLKSLNALRIENLAIPIKKATVAKDALRAKLANLSGVEVNGMYTQSYKDSEIARAKQAYRATLAALHKEVEASLTDLQNSLEEQHSELDLENPTWQNALKMVEMGGKDLSVDTIHQLVKPFAHDQPALAALQSVFMARGLASDGGIDKMRYDIPSTLSKLQDVARETFINEGGSINRFASAVGKVAGFEGQPFETLPDPAAVDEAIYRGAGLPSEVK